MYIKRLSLLSRCISVIVFLIIYLLISVILILITNSREIPVERTMVHSEYPVIIIDPGHGGADGGATTEDGIAEKNINLDISCYLEEFLQLSGIKCILTRREDKMLSPNSSFASSKKRADLIARVEIAKQYSDAIFVSIHQNKFSSGKYRGLQVFYSKNNENSKVLAENVKCKNIELLDSGNAREIKPAGSEIYVLDSLDIPAILIECGFLSNADEAKMLCDPSYQKKLAFTFYAALVNYLCTIPR